MTSEFWGMTGFFITTIILAITNLIFRQKLLKARRLISQLQGKANRERLDVK